MARVKWQVASRRRRKRLLKQAKGYYGARSKHIRRAKETVMRAKAYATRDRKVKKREFRSLWIIRLNAAARSRGTTYGRLIAGLRRSSIGLNRKQLSELALNDPAAFEQVMATVLGQAAEAVPPSTPPARASKKTALASSPA
ncbi:MAG: 50S ribosomal protein L20 [Candidatus Omnitrophica bacterium]|nr:50S ribosomal protein L20 [Candidatus Omnitrophota bacterium]